MCACKEISVPADFANLIVARPPFTSTDEGANIKTIHSSVRPRKKAIILHVCLPLCKRNDQYWGICIFKLT